MGKAMEGNGRRWKAMEGDGWRWMEMRYLREDHIEALGGHTALKRIERAVVCRTLLAGAGLWAARVWSSTYRHWGRLVAINLLTLTIGFAVIFRHSCSVGFGVAAMAAHTHARAVHQLSQCRR